MFKKNFAVATIKGLSLDAIAEIGTGAVDERLDAFHTAAINERNLREGLTWYIKHVTEPGVVNNISDAFIKRLAQDSALAKYDLRHMFRRVGDTGVWNEQRQCVMSKVTLTRTPDADKIYELAKEIVAPYVAAIPATDTFARRGLEQILATFANPKRMGDDGDVGFNRLNLLAPRAYRKNRPLQRIFQEFCKAIGVYNAKSGSFYQKLYAKLAEEMSSCTEDYTLILSLDPGIFETITNPKFDTRDNPKNPDKWMLHSCHALNHDTCTFGAGNSGYARDDVTFVAFIVKKPENLESWYNRKIRRQLYFYKVGNNALIQSRLYNEHGGVWGEDSDAKAIREVVQAIISECEGCPNKWETETYDGNCFGYDGEQFYCDVAEGFQGYPDWDKFYDGTIKISVRDTRQGREPFTIGAPSLCVNCGEVIFYYDDDCEPSYFCDGCNPDVNHIFCSECGCVIREDEAIWVTNSDGDEVQICPNCAENYVMCAECGCWYHKGDCTELWDEHWVCNACKEAHYVQCDDCGSWEYKGDTYRLQCRGEEISVCESCFDENYRRCNQCKGYFYKHDLDEDGYCENCAAERENDGDSAE